MITLTASNAAAEQKITALESANEAAIQAKDAEIASLQEQVAELGKNASGTGSTVVATGDEHAAEAATKKAGLLDPEHPLNQYASEKIASSKNPRL